MERLANRILLLTGWRRAGLAFAAGALTVLAQAPFHLFVVCFVTFPVLVWLLDGAFPAVRRTFLDVPWPAFVTGWWFGFGYFVAGLWWIGNALFVEAEEFLWLWPVAILGLPAVLAVFYGLAAALARLLWSDGIARIAALAFGFAMAEWLRTFILTGFPWNAIGYAAMPEAVSMQAASVVGILGMNALAVFVFALPAAFAHGAARAVAAAALLIVLVGVDLGFGVWRLGGAEPPADDAPVVRIVQPSVDQASKWVDGNAVEIFDMLLSLSTREGEGEPPDIVVWPETAVPFILTREPGALAAISEALGDGQTLLTGAVREDDTAGGGVPRYYNSILAISGEGVIFAAADKLHLVPFGEYLPLADTLSQLGLEAIAAADRGYSASERRAPLSLPHGIIALPSICYEAIFPAEVDYVGDGANLIVNVTNDAWYGDSPGPYQHAHHARIRAVETGLPMVRAANSGISAIYDGYGRQLAALGYGVRGAIDQPLPEAVPVIGAWLGRRAMFWIVAGVFGVCLLCGRFLGSKRLV